MAALTATGLSLLWLSSVLNRRAEAEPHHNSCASSLPCQTHEQRSKGRSLYLYSEFRASLLCSRNLRAAGSSCPPQLRITKSDKTPQLLAASTPAHQDPAPLERSAGSTAPVWLQSRVQPAPCPFLARPAPSCLRSEWSRQLPLSQRRPGTSPQEAPSPHGSRSLF